MSHAPPGEPVELGDVQRLDLAREKEREGVVEAAARAVLAAGDIQLWTSNSGGMCSSLRAAASWHSRCWLSGENGSWGGGIAETRRRAPADSCWEECEGEGVAGWDAAGMAPSIERLFGTEYYRTSTCAWRCPAGPGPAAVPDLPAVQGAGGHAVGLRPATRAARGLGDEARR